MPVPASINDLSTTPGSNSPPGSESPATIDDYLRAHAAFIAQLRDGKLAASLVSAFMLTVLDDADAAAARATLGANNAANLTTGTLPNERLNLVSPTIPTYVNSFTSNGGRYMQSGKVVTVIIGAARSTSPSSAMNIFTLPDGMRPPFDIAGIYCSYTQTGSFGQASLEVSSAGVVRYVGHEGPGGAANFTMNGLITFVAS